MGVGSNTPILGGTIYRSSLADIPVGLATGMRLRQLGVTYHSTGFQFESLTRDLDECPGAGRSLELVSSYRNHEM
jgi:hypothetical protein